MELAQATPSSRPAMSYSVHRVVASGKNADFNVNRLSGSSFSSTSLRTAKVERLSNPQSQLFEKVDAFIFDCDGVIWKVRLRLFFYSLDQHALSRKSNSWQIAYLTTT
jgi:hypothetical protein